MEKRKREIIRDYLYLVGIYNEEEINKEEIMSKFNIKKCEICGDYNLEEDLIDTESTKGIGIICEDCLEDSKE